MRRTTIFFLFSLYSYICLAQNIEDFFIQIPNHYLTTNADQRRELIQKATNGEDSTVLNNYGGFSKLLILDRPNNHIRIQTSEQGFLDAKGWLLKDSSVLYALSFWVCSPACDGEVHFFNSNNFSGINRKMPKIEMADFFDKDSLDANKISEDELKNRLGIFFLRFEFESGGDAILAINDIQKHLNKEDYLKWKSYLIGDCLPLIWENGSFKKENAYFREE